MAPPTMRSINCRRFTERRKPSRNWKRATRPTRRRASPRPFHPLRLYEEYLQKASSTIPTSSPTATRKASSVFGTGSKNLNNTDVFVKNETPLTNVRLNMKIPRRRTTQARSLLHDQEAPRPIHPGRPSAANVRHYIVIDECSFFLEVPRIEHMIVRTVQEGRKFGLGLILATQNPLKFNNDILSTRRPRCVCHRARRAPGRGQNLRNRRRPPEEGRAP